MHGHVIQLHIQTIFYTTTIEFKKEVAIASRHEITKKEVARSVTKQGSSFNCKQA